MGNGKRLELYYMTRANGHELDSNLNMAKPYFELVIKSEI